MLWNPEPGPQLQSRPGTDASISSTPAQEPVDVKDLLYGFREGEYSNQVLIINQLSLGDNTAEYHKLEVRSQVDLEDYLGEALEEVPGWSRLRGHEDLQYLIGPDGDGELALWEFAYFVPEEGETYSYRTVLEDIYHIFSAEDIAQITVSPGNMDNTDEGGRPPRRRSAPVSSPTGRTSPPSMRPWRPLNVWGRTCGTRSAGGTSQTTIWFRRCGTPDT